MRRERSDFTYPGAVALLGVPIIVAGLQWERRVLLALGAVAIAVGVGMMVVAWIQTDPNKEDHDAP